VKRRPALFAPLAAMAILAVAPSVRAQLVAAEPAGEVVADRPRDALAMEVQVALQLVVDARGTVLSAVETSRVPASAPESFARAAVDAVKAARFSPSTRDGRPIRSRLEYVVVFPAAPSSTGSPSPPAPRSEPATIAPSPAHAPDVEDVRVRGQAWSSPRGLGDFRVTRDLIDASPRQQTGEMLSAAPGFFVDHEDGEGLGNDVYLRGFDLDHGSGIEMRVGTIPVNIPTHIQGQGYADASFIIPEVVRSIRVLEGPYDPRQGDAAIVGSAYFDLGVPERGYQVKTSYGSWNQARVVGVAAPKEADDETFAAFSLRSTDGFGQDRASQSASLVAQYGVDLGARDHVRLLATAYGARASLPGVVRQDDVDAGRIDYYGSYADFGQGQGVQSSRVIFGADLDHVTPGGARFELAPWVMWTSFRARQNFTGDLESSQINPAADASAPGDLFETTNVETAAGLTARFQPAPWHVAEVVDVVAEPGLTLRAGHTDQTKSLLDPTPCPAVPSGAATPPCGYLQAWDRRVDASLDTLDAGAYLDLDIRLWKRLRLSGGLRADLLMVSVDNTLANVVPAGFAAPNALPGDIVDVEGVALGPRVTAEYELTPSLSPVVSYGQGFRSLDAQSLTEGATPYSKVASVEAGLRAQGGRGRYTSTLSVFETIVGNELVFEAAAGGMQTESASRRSGMVGSLVARPTDWLVASSALSVNQAVFTTLVPGVSHYVPNIPAVLLRADVAARGPLLRVRGAPITGRLGVGYTLMGGRHLTDTIIGPTNNILNAGVGLRYGRVEVGVDVYNLLGLKYADDEEVYVSNWSTRPGQQPASVATHITAAPPLSCLGTVALYL
jgi:hypothetical protein